MSPRLRRSRLHGSRLGSAAQVAVIALLVIAVLAGIAQPVQGAGPSQERKFDIRFTSQFNGGALASGVSVPTGARFSRLVIVAHNGHVTFWEESGSASAGVEELAEDGTYSGFEDEVNAAVAAGNARALETFPDHTGPTGGKEKRSFKVDGDFPYITVLAKVQPSSDWFIGVSKYDLRPGGSWISTNTTVNLHPLDAGTLDGTEFTTSGTWTETSGGAISSLKGEGKFSDRQIAKLVVKPNTPAKTRDVDARGGAESIRVSWSEAFGASGYTVLWKSGDETFETAEDDGRTATVDGGTTLECVIDDLETGTEYRVRVVAFNEAGSYGGVNDHQSEGSATPFSSDDVLVNFGSATYSVDENDDVTVTVTLGEDPGASVTILLTKANGGGATSSDYSGVPPNLTFDSGETSKSFVFSAADDSTDDDEDQVTIGLGTLPAGYAPGSNDETIVSINDNDYPSIQAGFSQASYSVTEGSSVILTLNLTAAPERSITLRVQANPRDGATSADYSGVPVDVVFAAAETSQTFSFAATADDVDEDGERVKLEPDLRLPRNVGLGNNFVTHVNIYDDPAVAVSFEEATYTVDEGSTVTVKVKLSADPERLVTIPLTKMNRGGAADTDYSVVPTSVTFASGDTEKTFIITAVDDSTDDDDESVKIGFDSPLPDRVTPGSTENATVNITDDDDPQVTVSFVTAAYSVAEGGQQAIMVRLSEDPERTVTFDLTFKHEADGATADDYDVSPVSLTFESGVTKQSVTFSATADNEDDDGETVEIGFGAMPAGVTEASSGSEVVVTITQVPIRSSGGGGGSRVPVVVLPEIDYTLSVLDNRYWQAPLNPELKHNVPDLEVTLVEGTIVGADFIGHYERTGGFRRWGYPTSEVLVLEDGTLTQFYQRGVVDFHDVGLGWVVERRLAWDYVGGGADGAEDQGVERHVTNPNPGILYGPWGHKVSDFAVHGERVGFAEFFNAYGGVGAFGLPKTDARRDSDQEGTLLEPDKTLGFIRQYFQAAVLEFHPDDPAGLTVKLTLLGDTLRGILVPDHEEHESFNRAEPLVRDQEYKPYVVPESTS